MSTWKIGIENCNHFVYYTEIYNNTEGCNSIDEVEEACQTISVDELVLSYNITMRPNPFSTSTTLEYKLKQPEIVQLSVYNQLGQLVYQHSEEQTQGSQQLHWKADDQPDGLYYYRLQVGEQITNGKLVKVK